MRHFRLSIAQIMLLVLFIGLTIGALRSPSPLMARTTWTSTAALLCWAIVAAIFRHDHRRAFWVGFAVFGWVHLVLTFGLNPTAQEQLIFPCPLPPLLTNDFIDFLRSQVPPLQIPRAGGVTMVVPASAGGVTTFAPASSGSFVLYHVRYLEFHQIALLLTTLFVALLGGWISRLMVGWSSRSSGQ